MYTTRIIITLLGLAIAVLFGVVIFLIFHEPLPEQPRETSTVETTIFIPSSPPEEASSTSEADVSQENGGEARALGTDHGMEFPTLEE